MVLNPRKSHFKLFGMKENEQVDIICNGITLKHSSHDKILGVNIDNKFSFDEHIINICKRANKKLNAQKKIKRKCYCHPSYSLISAIVPLFGSFAPQNLLKR